MFLFILLAAVNEFKKSGGKTSIGVSLHSYSSLDETILVILNINMNLVFGSKEAFETTRIVKLVTSQKHFEQNWITAKSER